MGLVQRFVRVEELRLQHERHLHVVSAVAVDIFDQQEFDEVLGRGDERNAARRRVGHEGGEQAGELVLDGRACFVVLRKPVG